MLGFVMSGMGQDLDASSFVDAAREKGATDETIVMLLRERGWSEKLARQELTRYYEGLIGQEVPVHHDPIASNPLDGFLYVFATGTLVSWVTSAIVLGNGFIDDAFPATPSQTGGSWEMAQVVYAVATLLVTGPIYLVLMAILHRRLRLGASSWGSPVRLWILSITLLIGVATILGYFVTTLASCLQGAPTTATLLKSAYALVLLIGLASYYLHWLRNKGKTGDTL